MQESSLHYSAIGAESAPATLPYDPWIMANSHPHSPKKWHFHQHYQYFMTCSPLRTVCAKLFPIWADVIDHFPASYPMAKALVSRGFCSPSGA
jgi:hypothetical protein